LSKAVVLAIVLGVLLTGCAASELGGDSIAKVNGQTLTTQQLNVRLTLYELFFNQPMSSPGAKQQMLDQMVTERILLEQADRQHIAVTDAQVESEMTKFLSTLERQYKSRDEVDAKLQALGLTNDAVAGFVRDYLTSQAVLDRKKAEVSIAEDEVREYYNQNKDKLYTFQEDAVRAAQVLVPLDQEAKAREIAAKARAGGDFAELARQYSIDPGSRPVGGDLGYFKQGTTVKEFSDAAFAANVGEVTDPVRSEFGWHVIHVLDRRGPGTVPYDVARDEAMNRMLAQKQTAAVDQWLTDLKKGATIDEAGKNE